MLSETVEEKTMLEKELEELINKNAGYHQIIDLVAATIIRVAARKNDGRLMQTARTLHLHHQSLKRAYSRLKCAGVFKQNNRPRQAVGVKKGRLTIIKDYGYGGDKYIRKVLAVCECGNTVEKDFNSLMARGKPYTGCSTACTLKFKFETKKPVKKKPTLRPLKQSQLNPEFFSDIKKTYLASLKLRK